MSRKRLSGNMLMSTLVGIAISVLLIGIGANAFSKQQAKSKRSAVASELTIMATALQDAYVDLGAPEFDASEIDAFKHYLEKLENGYVGVEFDLTSVTAIPNGFRVEVSSPVDSFQSRYIFRMATSGSSLGNAMVISPGPNLVSEEASYTSDDFGDDIIAVVSVAQ